MSTLRQPPRIQLGDAPLAGYAGSETDQIAILWQTEGDTSDDTFTVEYRAVGETDWNSVDSSTINHLFPALMTVVESG